MATNSSAALGLEQVRATVAALKSLPDQGISLPIQAQALVLDLCLQMIDNAAEALETAKVNAEDSE